MVLEGRRRIAKGEKTPLGITYRLERDLELLRRHIVILKTILENEPIGIIRISELTGYPQHKVRYSLRVLEQAGLIEPTPQGAITTGKVEETLTDIKSALEKMSKICNDMVAYIESPRES